MTTGDTQMPGVASFPQRNHDRVQIVGFAPSLNETPWEEINTDRWGMNTLHRQTPDRPWTGWFQLHDINTHHKADLDHLAWLKGRPFPIFMWGHHVEKYEIENAVAFPVETIFEIFQFKYFTNTVSWAIALAVVMGYEEISIFGVDMAADTEYGHQRPSCEYVIGVAEGRGHKVYVPDSSDLLKAPALYGMEDTDPLYNLIVKRRTMLQERQGQLMGANNQNQVQISQLGGALEDIKWFERTFELVKRGVPIEEITDNGEPSTIVPPHLLQPTEENPS
ncbi:MAG: hypothetical protein QNL12_03260 [Acidimicrobiia bacterium]|nr:hypothetical protein [Acidimicrobiia bacterium]